MSTSGESGGIVELIRERKSRLGPTPAAMLNFMDGIQPLLTEAADTIERLTRELKASESAYMTAVGSRLEWRHAAEVMERRALSAESRLRTVEAALNAALPLLSEYEFPGARPHRKAVYKQAISALRTQGVDGEGKNRHKDSTNPERASVLSSASERK